MTSGLLGEFCAWQAVAEGPPRRVRAFRHSGAGVVASVPQRRRAGLRGRRARLPQDRRRDPGVIRPEHLQVRPGSDSRGRYSSTAAGVRPARVGWFRAEHDDRPVQWRYQLSFRLAAVALCALALLPLAGRGGASPAPTAPPLSSAAPATAALPPRPVTLSLDNLVDPCSLLTPAQRQQLSVQGSGTSDEDFGGPLQGGPICLWVNTAEKPDNEYTGSAVLNHGAEYALGNEPLRMVDGFAATTTTSVGSDPNYYCGLLVRQPAQGLPRYEPPDRLRQRPEARGGHVDNASRPAGSVRTAVIQSES
jgi:hypothetical protein